MASSSNNLPAVNQVTACSPAQLSYPPYREPSFEVATQRGINIARLIVDTLNKSPRTPPENLLKEAKDLAEFRVPTEKLIGFLGDSGHGKSSTLNSVLDDQDLARAEACGTAVTPYAVEYCFQQPRHQSAFTLECTLMVGKELRTYLGRLLSDFRRFTLADPQERAANFEGLQSDRRAAQDIFEAAFGRMDGFDLDLFECKDDGICQNDGGCGDEERRGDDRSCGDDESCDGDEGCEDDGGCQDVAMTILDGYRAQLAFPEDMTPDGVWIKGSQTAAECQDHQSLIQDRGLWPFVKSMTIYSEIGILSQGLTLIDLPGLQDTNLARVRAARKMQAKCDEIFLVANIGRVVDNPTIGQTLESLQAPTSASITPARSVTIICTHSADLSDTRPIEKLVNLADLREAKAEVRRVESQCDDYPSVKAYKDALKRAVLKLNTLLIDGRNKKVQAELTHKYSHLARKGKLRVFCVDNVEYSKDSDKQKELSGIPQLRQYLADLPAEALFQEKNSFISDRIPALVASFMTWMESSRINSNAEQPPYLPDLDKLRLSQAVVVDWDKQMNAIFCRHIGSSLGEASGSIESNCLHVAKGWAHWAHQSVAAWLRHEGTHRTPTLGYRCWNMELLRCFNEVMCPKYREFHAGIDPLLRELETNVIRPWKTYEEQCQQLQAPRSFLRSLAKRSDKLRDVVARALKRYSREEGRVIVDANSAHSASYIVDCMLETYYAAQKIPGKHGTIKRHNKLQARVSSQEFVENFRDLLSEGFEEAVSKARKTVEKALRAEFKAVQTDLEVIQQSNGPDKLFKVYLKYGCDCEQAAVKIQKQMDEMDGLAATAREMAKKQYGGDSHN
ncbi:hypothetical protein A1O3_08939 [Capronia epimyces CBS 606.96]|uniref:DUF7605 domain-containing protein n=1 Tax=Capronia epimyces CBS 606.96 TaxID=1182542 RepID=W9XG21_9EURO|nr:uncharacterized protein A1O3_08939 [Capronia epimyces CBS 606.96]EXJ79437.1 hypothetical protein A1O3_08939 [Capronia epimyces CBS 606.96]